MSEPIKLPRVSPENLVEGEWYLVKHFGGAGFDFAQKQGYLNIPGDDWPYMAEEFEAIAGPLPHFEIEEQA